MEGFEGIMKALNIENDDNLKQVVANVEKTIEVIENKRNEIDVTANNTFPDQEFISTELRSLISSARSVMTKVENDIRIGAEPRQIEVYAKLIEAIGKQYSCLIELNKSIFDAQVKNNLLQPPPPPENDNKITLSPEELLDMMIKAKQKSQLNSIDAHFEIENEKSI
jgi:hypothetical protein